jgi:hypothetical protein
MHPPSGPAALVWLELSPIGVAMRQWLWLYPGVEVVHIVGFVLLVGAAFMFDLRLLGFARPLSVAGMARHLLRWSRVGLALVVPTGALMFVAHATEMAASPVFRLKLALIVAAGLNALVFHRGTFRSATSWDRDVTAPAAARASAVASLLLWTTVICCGRLLAYF